MEGKPAPELIILDLQMPIMDGLEFLDALPRRDHFDRLINRVIMVTG